MLDGMDSGQATEGTPASPNASGSQKPDASSGSSQGNLQASLEALTLKLAEIDQRTKALQSDKDRGVTKARKEVEELKQKFAQVEQLKKRGLNEDEAFEEIELREAVHQIRSQIASANPTTQTVPAGNVNPLADTIAKTLSQYGLSENDPDVAVEMAGKTYNSPVELENAALRIAFKRNSRPAPDASASLAIEGSAPRPANPKQMQQEYVKEITQARGNKAAVKAIQEKYRKAGFDPGSVHFSV